MQETLQEKIKRVLAFTGKTIKELAYDLGVSTNNLYKYKASSNPRDRRNFDKLMNDLDRILENSSNYNNLNEKQAAYSTEKAKGSGRPLMVSIYLNQEALPEVYTEGKAIPGTVIDINGKPALIAYRSSSPIIGNVDGLITVAGDSMAPRFKSGSMIAVTRLKFNKILVAGNCYYIIDKNNVGILRRIVMTENEKELLLISENGKEYPAFIRRYDDIKAIFKVEAVVTKQSM